MTTALHPHEGVKLKTASGGSYQKPLKSFGDLTFETQYCTGFTINLSANSPSVSCSTSEDPIGVDGGLNLNSFVGSNPITFTDKFGLERDWSSEMPNGGGLSNMSGGEFTALFGASPAEIIGWTIKGTWNDLKDFNWCCYSKCMLKKNTPALNRKISMSFHLWMTEIFTRITKENLMLLKSVASKFSIIFYASIAKSAWECYLDCRE